jgi:hypothetical protein
LPSSPTPGGTVSLQGTLSIDQTVTADLDRGVTFADNATADLWFEAVTSSERHLTPQNGARFVVAGTTEPGYAACKAAPTSGGRIPIESLTAGSYVCGMTNQGRVVQLHIDQAAAPFSGCNMPTLVVTYATYH